MSDIIRIPFNDVFFYGVSLRSREDSSPQSDVFSNIIMRYLRTLEPVTNRLYRTADGNRYEYSYSFVPTRPISWRVIKNKRVIEDIEQLSDGKYCLSYYDDQGNDVKRAIFGKDHKWLKTNYYNSIYGNTLLCSVLPKELNGETVILQYLTGATYPVTHFCCRKASCKEVQDKVFARSPLPEISALTNYGLLYFATEETLKIYNQVLEEEEAKYAEEHKPPVYTTDEDIASGFCFSEESFDSGVSVFSLDEASELTEDDLLSDNASATDDISCSDDVISEEVTAEEDIPSVISSEEEKPFNIEEDISAVLELIKNTTNVEIDSSAIFEKSEDNTSEEELQKIFEEAEIVSEPEEPESLSDEIINDASPDLISTEITDDSDSEVKDFVIELNSTETEYDEDILNNQDVNLLSMEDEEIDDYVKTLIDSLLTTAKTASGEYLNTSDEGFETQEETDITEVPQITAQESAPLDEADGVIESGNETYYYFGDYTKENGRNGRGRTLMSDGKTAYEGDYRNDMRHGVGAFYYRSGDLCYFGNWSENKRSGFGMGFNSDTGISHTGNWSENKPNGVGVRFDKFGNFLYLDSHSERVNGGIRVIGFTEKSLKIEYWDEKTLSMIRKEIFIDDLV